MKTFLIVLLGLAMSKISISQTIVGKWEGELSMGATSLRIVFNISENGSGYSATMDSPDQGAFGIEASATTYTDGDLTIMVPKARITYAGRLSANNSNLMEGEFIQMGKSLPLNLKRGEAGKVDNRKPQEPREPFNYEIDDVNFNSAEKGVVLAATLTKPKGNKKYPTIILISGSGPQNRNEEIMGHKPFWVIADYLTKNGYAVLRYDDRGTAESTGNFMTATTANLAMDALGAVNYLKTRNDVSSIGLMGHSEGGVIAPMVANKTNDVNFIVLLAGTGVRGKELLLLQQEYVSEIAGISEADMRKNRAFNEGAFDILIEKKDTNGLSAALTEYTKKAFESGQLQAKENVPLHSQVNALVKQFKNPWIDYFVEFDPATELEQVQCPVLAINGDKDVQVPADENLTAIKVALAKGGNKQVKIKKMKGLNHLFQTCETGSASEYATIDETFSPKALKEILKWLNKVAD